MKQGHPHPPGAEHPGGSSHPDRQTIKEAYRDGRVDAHRYMVNPENRLRLIFWETTAGCNLTCVHCRRLEVSRKMMENDLTTVECFDLVDQVARMKGVILVLSGGEPLIRPDIFDIARRAVTRGVTLAMASNGTMIDPRMAQRIVDSGIGRVSISLDGADSKTHDAFRQLEGSFERAIRGIRNLQDLGMSCQINVTVARHNVHQLKDIYRMALDLRVDALHLFMLVPVGCGVLIADDQMLDANKYEEVLNWFYDVTLEKKIQTKATCAPHYFRIMRQRAAKDGIPISPETHGMAAMTKGCLAGTGICFISHQGNVFPCGYLPVTAGSIKTKPLKEIWENSPVFLDLRDPQALRGKCGVCEYKQVCEGCRARAYFAQGNYLEEEPYCTYVPERTRLETI